MATERPEKNFNRHRGAPSGVARSALAPPQEAGVTNLRVIRHDDGGSAGCYDPERFLSCLQLFFPTSGNKSRHHKRRIVQPAFAQDIRQSFAIGGVFHMATDWENSRRAHALEVMSAAEGTRTPPPPATGCPSRLAPSTNFEQRPSSRATVSGILIFKRVN